MFLRTIVWLLATCWILAWFCTSSYGQSSGWKAAKLKSDSVSFGQISSSGSGITVEGKFTDTSRVYQVLAEQGQFVKVSDGQKSGWVFRVNLEAVTEVAPDDPDLDNKPTTSRDPLIGQYVFFKDSAVAMVGSQVIDKYKVLNWPNRVGDVQGDWVWLGRAWIRRSELMLLPEAFDYSVEEVRRNPQSADAWRNRGNCWLEKKEYDNAIKDYDESLRLDPKSAVTWSNRGLAKDNKRDYDGAIRDHEEAIRLDPKYASAWNNRGVAKAAKQDYDGAIRDYDEAIRLDPKYVRAWSRRGSAKYSKQDYDGAIRDYDEAIRLDPKDAWTWNSRGSAKYSKQDYDGAILDYDEAIRIDAKDVNALQNRGLAKRIKQDYDGAIRDYDEALRLDPKDVWTWNSRGWGKYLQKDYDQSILDYDEAIRLDPKYVHAWNHRGLAKAAKQDYDGAILDYDEAIRLDPKYVHAWNNRGLAKAAKQDYDGAILDCDEAIRLDPKYVRAWNNRGSAKSRKQDHDGAIRDYDEAIRLDPKYAWGWYSRGLTRLVTRHSAATQDLAQVLELQGWQGDSSSYSVVFGCLAARLLGDESRAQKFLTDAEGKLKQEWPFPVLAYLQGQRSADDLLVLASDNDQQTEAHCYIGLNLLASGNTIDAREHLGWVRDHGNKSYVEFPISLAELDRLKDASQEPSSSLAATAQQPIRRVLTDASGDGQVHVDVLRLDGSTVHVRTLEGKEMTLSLDNLSELDREWLKRNFGR